MMQDDLQDGNSSKDSSEELVIKPPQTSSETGYVSQHNNKKKRRHSEGHKSSKKHHHHHHHKTSHLRLSHGDSARNQNILVSKSFHYRSTKGKDRNKESKKVWPNQGMIDASSRKLIKDVSMNDRERNVEYQTITDVRHVKEIRESRMWISKNEDRNTCVLEKMKVEWRKKRLQWLQQQTTQDKRICTEKEEDNEDIKWEGEFKEHPENIRMEHSSNQKSSAKCLQIDDEEYYDLVSPVPSEGESVDYKENEKSEELIDDENKYLSDQEDGVTMSDISDDEDDDVLSKSEYENAGIESADEKEKATSHAESLLTDPSETVETFKKEDLNTNSMKENGISSISQENCSTPGPADLHTPTLPVYCPAIQGCRSIDGFQVLNRIEEGTYGVVYRAKDKETKEIVALKRLKMEREKEGFPITSLREINTLLKAQHPNIVTVREIVVGSNMDRIYIVMDYVEHDLKSLMKTMPRPFLIGEVKTLLIQLLCAVAHLHDNWILHRDLKTSNLLLSHQGILKVGDFGLAREYGSPLKSYTPVVVTLWYRAPELLLGVKKYSTAIDMWSVGCIFGELLTKTALFPGKSESDQINRIFKDLGTPSEHIWPGYSELPLVKSMNITQYPYNILKGRFSHTFSDVGLDLLNKFLTYNPARRISAEKAKSHEFFNEKPRPVPPNMFPTWPARSEQEYRTARSSPKPPLGGINYSKH